MRVLVSADAEDDLVDGARFYDSIEPGLGVRFIYAVYYSLADDLLRVHAVLDCRQDPEKTQKRMTIHFSRHAQPRLLSR